ncbi:tyrosine/phenylalanine carboxypeptidase domain-containing protein, partial [Elusimicrobiota bacterium]
MKKIDVQFKNIDHKLLFYSLLIPVNMRQEHEKFISDESYNPQFRYRISKEDIDKVKYELDRIVFTDFQIGVFYSALKDEYYKKIKLIESIGDPETFTDVSCRLYGVYSEDDLKYAEKILHNYSDNGYEEIIEPEVIKSVLEKLIAEKNINGWKVIL